MPKQGSGAPALSRPDLPHVLLILDGFPKHLGGGERIALRLAELLPRYGFRASILTFTIHPESPVLATAYPFPIYLLPLNRTYDLTAIRAAVALSRFLRHNNVRIVHTFFESSDLWAGLVTKALSPARLIWSRRDLGILRSPKHAHAYRLLRRLPDLVLAVSEQVRMHAINTDRIRPTRVRTLYNGIDVGYWSSTPRPDQRNNLLILTIGNVRRVKGHDLLIRAAALVLQDFPNASFTILGQSLESAYSAELQTLIGDLHLADHFQILAAADPRDHLRKATLFVLPSRSEGFSNAILEAMASGLPVVATNVGGNAEAVLHAVTGLIVPPEDPEALARAILQLLSDLPALPPMGAAGKQRVATLFSTSAMMESVAAAYDELLLSTRPEPPRTPRIR